jgi:hypothetical protein
VHGDCSSWSGAHSSSSGGEVDSVIARAPSDESPTPTRVAPTTDPGFMCVCEQSLVSRLKNAVSFHVVPDRVLLCSQPLRASARGADGQAAPPRATAMNAGLQFTDSVICYKELIDKEDTARRLAKQRNGQRALGWRPVEPFEATGASNSKLELPSEGIPGPALRNPSQFMDNVGNDSLAGGTPLRFGGRWDVLHKDTPQWDSGKPQRVVKQGPHDCYCGIGYNCWSQAGKARTANFGLMGVFEREFWSNTPGELALVWDVKGEGAHVDPKAKAAAAEAAKKKAEAAARVN